MRNLAKKWARASGKLREACRARGIEPPTFGWNNYTFTATFTRPSYVAKATTPVTPTVRKLLVACQTEKSRDELQHAMGLADKMHFIEVYLRPALKAGLVEYTIPAEGRRFLVDSRRASPRSRR